MASIALRNLWARRLRTFLTALRGDPRRDDDRGHLRAHGHDLALLRPDLHRVERGRRRGRQPRTRRWTPTTVTCPRSTRRSSTRSRRGPGVEAASGGSPIQQTAIIGSDGERVGGNGAPGLAFSTVDERFDPLTYEEGGPTARPTARSRSTSRRPRTRASSSVTRSRSPVPARPATLDARRHREARQLRVARRRHDLGADAAGGAGDDRQAGQSSTRSRRRRRLTTPERLAANLSARAAAEPRGRDRRGEHRVAEGGHQRGHRLPEDGAAGLRRASRCSSPRS